MRRLSELRRGEMARVIDFDGRCALVQRLMAMAMLPGEQLKIVRTAPFGGPITIQLQNSLLSIRRQDAARVFISEE